VTDRGNPDIGIGIRDPASLATPSFVRRRRAARYSAMVVNCGCRRIDIRNRGRYERTRSRRVRLKGRADLRNAPNRGGAHAGVAGLRR